MNTRSRSTKVRQTTSSFRRELISKSWRRRLVLVDRQIGRPSGVQQRRSSVNTRFLHCPRLQLWHKPSSPITLLRSRHRRQKGKTQQWNNVRQPRGTACGDAHWGRG
ncbi:metal ABC transporter ATP-binding protein [Sesbania bispinosa]|nr:metal ABC transporter ATP-binding protein [Sesbania bispinosa]